MDLKVISYNCFSIRKRIDPIREILRQSDILILQEIILCEEDCYLLYQIDNEFDVIYQPSKTSDSLGDGRPAGGLAVFHRKSCSLDITDIVKN